MSFTEIIFFGAPLILAYFLLQKKSNLFLKIIGGAILVIVVGLIFSVVLDNLTGGGVTRFFS